MGSLTKPEAQSEKDCADCVYYDRPLTSIHCWDCIVCPEKHNWKKNETSGNGSEQVGHEDCRICKKPMFQ